MIPDDKDDDLVDETTDETPDDDTETNTEEEAEATAPAVDLSHVKWDRVGPALFAALHDLMASPKSKHEGHYIIKVQDADVGAAHDALAAITKA